MSRTRILPGVAAAGIAAAAFAGALPARAATSSPAHAAIAIQSDADFAACHCVVSGAGTTASPYVIGPWSINSFSGTGVLIDGSTLTKSFVLRNLTLAGNRAATSRGIVLQHINSGGAAITASVMGAQTSIQHTNVGITVSNSNGVVLDGGGANSNGPGIGSGGTGTINHNSSGAIDVESSGHVMVRGWQLSSNGGNIPPDWVGLDPGVQHWGVGGVRFFDVTDSTIDHVAANNDTTLSYALFDSGGDTVSNDTADYPFTSNVMVADGSANDVISGNLLGTADFIGILVADPLPGSPALSTYGATHDIVVRDNVDHSDGPTGSEISSGVTPAFLGGIVLLNGTYDNSVLDNSVSASTGTGLAWAQEVLNTRSAIGVATYPPLLHCNVTASEGGGGTAAHNGNIWSGNIVQKAIDPCIPAQ